MASDLAKSTLSTLAKPRRRWYQFTLRTAIVWMVLFSLLLGSFAWWRDRAERQRKVVEEMRDLGATVDYRFFSLRKRDEENEAEYASLYDAEEEFFLCKFLRDTFGDDFVYGVGEVRFSNSAYERPISPERTSSLLSHLPRFPHLKELRLEGNAFTGADLAKLPCLDSLERLVVFTRPNGPSGLLTNSDVAPLREAIRLKWLMLPRQPIGDSGVAQLTGLRELVELDLSGTSITDGCFESLRHLPKLRSLDLSDTKITGEGFRTSKLPTSLSELDLSNTQVSDSALEDLVLPNLTDVWLHDTKVTAEGKKRLQVRYPNCKIVIENWP